MQVYGGFLKWWYPTTIGFPTKNDRFRVFWGYHHLRKPPYNSGGICANILYAWNWINVFFTCHDGSQFANLSKSKDQNLWRNNTQNSTFLTSKAWPHLTCQPAQPGEFTALASLAAITAFSVSKGSCSSSASTGILLARRPSSLSVFRNRKYLSVSFCEGWRLHVQIWVEVFWSFHLTLFLAF